MKWKILCSVMGVLVWGMAPSVAGECDHSVALYDSYGDGWNGGKLDVLVNGVVVLDDITLTSGFGPVLYTFPADTGDTITTVYVAGGWSYENYYYIYDGNDTQICADGLGGATPVGCSCTGYCGGPLPGACCTDAGECYMSTVTDPGDCDTGDTYLGDNTVCTPNPCPQPPPVNDLCEDAILVDTYPTTLTGTTIGATVDCPGVLDWSGVWYVLYLPYEYNRVQITYCGTSVNLFNVGIVLVPDCTCSSYTLRDTGAWITCANGFQGYDMVWNQIAGPRTILLPALCESAGYLGMDFEATFNVTQWVPTYCASYATSTADSLCQIVSLGSLNNDSGTACATYTDFTGLTPPDLMRGTTYAISVTSNTCGGCYGKWTKVFIDWNQDIDFTDPGEQAYTSGALSNTCPHTFSGYITVPVDAALGTTRMRVVVREGGSETTTLPCGTYSWGETEDYTVNIIAAPQYGACCVDADCYSNVTADDCATMGGVYQGDGTVCVPNPCPQPPPEGDLCSNAFVIDALPFTSSGSTVGFNNDYDEVCPYTGSTSPDVVYQYHVDSFFDIFVEIDLCESDYDTKVYVYEDECVSPPIACNDDACSDSLGNPYRSRLDQVHFQAGHTYYIVVDGYGGASGNYELAINQLLLTGACCVMGDCVATNTQADCDALSGDWFAGMDCTTFVCPPINDTCVNRIDVIEGVYEFNTTNATYDGPGWCVFPPGNQHKNIWYCYTASCTGKATISLCGSSYDTVLALYHDCDCYPAQSMLQGCNDDACGTQSQITTYVHAGHQYLIEIGGYGSAAGAGILTITCEAKDYFLQLENGLEWISGGTGWNNGDWIYYPETNWWNQWWPNEFALDRVKEVTLEFDVQFIGPAPIVAFNYATPDWTDPLNPPGAGEDAFIVRLEVDPPITAPGHYVYTTPLPYCPAWVSVDIRGQTFMFDGMITHVCLPPVLGACCFPDGHCDYVTEMNCPTGDWREGVPCDPNPCPQPGACCYPDGTCAVTFEADCTGDWQGPNTVCDPNPCPQPGACCYPDGTCAVTFEADCTGDWQGPNTVCDPNPCPQPQGACCVGADCVATNTEAECAALTGVWYAGEDCATFTCPQYGGWFDDGGVLVSGFGDGSGWYGPYSYYHMWWPNVFSLYREKLVRIEIDVVVNPGGFLNLRLSWAPIGWSNELAPPMPGDTFDSIYSQDNVITASGHYVLEARLPFCPRWVSIGVEGQNAAFYGFVVHECLSGPTLRLEADNIRYCENGAGVLVDVVLDDNYYTVLGGQFNVDYDHDKLSFVGAVPGDAPFTRTIFGPQTLGDGGVFYSVGIPDGDPGYSGSGPITMATLQFTAIGEACGVDELVWLRTGAVPYLTRLTKPDPSGGGLPLYADAFEQLGAITLDWTGPVLSGCPENALVECDAVPAPPVVTATDNCDGDVPVAYEEVRADGSCPDEYILTRTWTAEDLCGNVTTCVQTITVVDTTPPVLSECPTDATVECDAVPAPPVVTATDNCDGDVPVAYEEVRADGSCPDEYTLTRTWTAEDDCHNVTVCTQVITVQDTTAPTFTSCPTDITVNAAAGSCEVEVTWPDAEATDNCGDVMITYWLGATQIGNPHTFPVGVHAVTVKAADDCANVNDADCSFTVTVLGYNDLVVDVQLSPTMSAAVTRCITFTLYDCDGTNVTFDLDVDFDANGYAYGVLIADKVACGIYDCITAHDELHTLVRRVDLSIAGGQFLADFTGDYMLVQGDLYDDSGEWGVDFIDIVDFGVFITEWGWTGNGSTPCGTLYPHADIDGDGTIDVSDYGFIATNYLTVGDAGCCRSALRGAPRESITTAELRAMGLGNVARMDLNRDGVFDMQDVALFLSGVRPGLDDNAARQHDHERPAAGVNDVERIVP